MKKQYILSLLCSLAICGCGNDDSNGNNNEPADNAECSNDSDCSSGKCLSNGKCAQVAEKGAKCGGEDRANLVYVKTYGGNNSEAVAYLAQIIESGNSKAIELAKHLYHDIFNEVEALITKGHRNESSRNH